MKNTKLMLAISALGFTSASIAQPKKPVAPVAKTVAKTVAKPLPSTVKLLNSTDSISYALGVLESQFLKQQGLTNINAQVLAEALKATLNGKPTLLTPEQADMTLREKLQAAAMQKSKATIQEGEAFLAKNAKNPNVKVTASGLQYEVIKLGTGPMPKDTNVVKVHYEGTLLSGKKFDSSKDRGQPAEFPLNQVIKGWTEGVQLMPVGSIYKFYIPYQLGYGMNGAGADIKPGAALIFEVELLEIK